MRNIHSSEQLKIARSIRNSSDALFKLGTAIIICDDAYQVILINPSAQELLDTGINLAIGQSIFSFLKDPDSPRLLEQSLLSNQSTTIRQAEFIDAQHRTKLVDCILTPMSFRNSKYLILEFNEVDTVVSNVKKNTMEASQNANSAVVRTVAHEIKNPLGGIRGAAQLLERELDPHPDLKEYTRIIVKETDRLCGLVDNMMGPQVPTLLKKVNIHEVLEYVRMLVLAEGLDDNQFIRDYDPSLPTIQGDFEQLVQVFVNIFQNAIEVIGSSGKVTVRTRVQRNVHIGKIRYQSVSRIDVVDNGPGVPKDILDKIFHPMISSKALNEGLGLSIVHQIITRHGGTVSCKSIPGHTCFSVFLKFYSETGSYLYNGGEKK